MIITVLAKLIPLLVLIAFGRVLKLLHFFSDTAIELLKKIVINLGLPAVLFLSFSTMTIELSVIWIIIAVGIMNILLLLYGKAIFRKSASPGQSFMLTGFEYGMFALALFSVAYGGSSDNAVSYIAVVDLGHELFIWFIFVPLVQSLSMSTSRSLSSTLKSFIENPIIISIILGLILNLSGLNDLLNQQLLWKGLLHTLDMMASLTAPLILLILGAGLSFSGKDLRFAAKIILLRLPLVLIMYFMIDFLLFRRILGLAFGFSAALFVLMISPPPFVLPLYLREKDKTDNSGLNTTLAVHTVLSLVIFIVYFYIYPSI
ncbi:MAG: transporter [Spirochaetales bacterium]|nr:transporter [Spirochaetales bacterium]